MFTPHTIPIVVLLEDLTFSDREKTCPLLLRVFCSQQRHNNMSEYMRGKYHLTQGLRMIWKHFQVIILRVLEPLQC